MVRIITLNINKRKNKLTNIIEWLNRKHADIILLQETTALKNYELTEMQNMWGGMIYENRGTRKSRGVITLLKNNLHLDSCENKKLDDKGRIIKTTIRLEQEKYNIYNIYAPSEGNKQLKQEFYHSIRDDLNPEENNIIGGDFNCVKEAKDKTTYNNTDRYLYPNELNKIQITMDMADIWRELNTNKRQYTFTHSQGGKSRLDRFLIDKHKQTRVKQCKIEPCHLSDHDAVILDIKTEKIKRGKGYWKLNNTLLENKHVRQEVSQILREWKLEKHKWSDIQKWWVICKKRIKKYLIGQGIALKKANRDQTLRLETELNELYEKELHDEITTARIKVLKTELREIDERNEKGIMIRSRQNILQNETCSKYFHIGEKRMQERKEIIDIVGQNGEVVRDQKDIINEIEKYYTNLYQSDSSDINSTQEILQAVENNVTEEERGILGMYVTTEEVRGTINMLNSNKSPGIDGFTSEFYKAYIDELSEDIAELYNNAFMKGILDENITEGIITLLYKKNCPSHIKNWRPISLLNIDYKILSKLMANRLKPIMKKLIKKHQSCGVKGRSIHDNIETVIKLMEYVNEYAWRDGCYLLCVDLEKAFDRIEHQYMYSTLAKFGLGNRFIKWVKLMYTDIRSQVLINGHLSNKIKIERSVRQGCPLSMLLFVLCNEPLLNQIELNEKIEGYKLPGGTNLKSMAYADDTSFIITKENEIEEIVEQYRMFRKASGEKINIEKTEILKMGKPKEGLSDRWKQFEKTQIKYLGVWLTESEMMALNMETVIKKIKKKITYWKTRNLSLWGRVYVTKTVLLNNIWHALQNIEVIPKEIKKIKKEIFEFIWRDRGHDPIERKTLELPIEEGGLGIINIEERLQAYKIKHIIENYNQDKLGKELFAYFFGIHLNRALPNYYSLSGNHTIRRSRENKVIIEITKTIVGNNRGIIENPVTRDIHREIKRYKSTHEVKIVRDGKITKEQLHKISNELKRDTFSTNHKSVEYQMIHDILPTEWYYTWKMGLPLRCCIHCEQMMRDTQHIMIDCTNIRDLRDICIREIQKIDSSLSEEDIKKLILETNTDTGKKIKELLRKYRTWVWENRNYKTNESEIQIDWNNLIKWKL